MTDTTKQCLAVASALVPRKSIFRHSLRVFLVLFFWYLSSFFLMMDWYLLAFAPDRGTPVGGSAYILAPLAQLPGDLLSVYGASWCWANWLFWPLDRFFWVLNDAFFPAYRHTTLPLTLVLFWVNLLLPIFSVVWWHTESRKSTRIQLLVALGAAGWYLGLIRLYSLMCHRDTNLFLGKSFVLIGTIVVLGALYWLGRNRSWLFVVPLAFATICATVWTLVSLPL